MYTGVVTFICSCPLTICWSISASEPNYRSKVEVILRLKPYVWHAYLFWMSWPTNTECPSLSQTNCIGKSPLALHSSVPFLLRAMPMAVYFDSNCGGTIGVEEIEKIVVQVVWWRNEKWKNEEKRREICSVLFRIAKRQKGDQAHERTVCEQKFANVHFCIVSNRAKASRRKWTLVARCLVDYRSLAWLKTKATQCERKTESIAVSETNTRHVDTNREKAVKKNRKSKSIAKDRVCSSTETKL